VGLRGSPQQTVWTKHFVEFIVIGTLKDLMSLLISSPERHSMLCSALISSGKRRGSVSKISGRDFDILVKSKYI